MAPGERLVALRKILHAIGEELLEAGMKPWEVRQAFEAQLARMEKKRGAQ